LMRFAATRSHAHVCRYPSRAQRSQGITWHRDRRRGRHWTVGLGLPSPFVTQAGPLVWF
jgi:hypothetical protein